MSPELQDELVYATTRPGVQEKRREPGKKRPWPPTLGTVRPSGSAAIQSVDSVWMLERLPLTAGGVQIGGVAVGMRLPVGNQFSYREQLAGHDAQGYCIEHVLMEPFFPGPVLG